MTTPDEQADPGTGIAIRRVVVGALETNCWIVRDAESAAAVVIDPGDEADRILAAAAGLDVRAVVLTHAHFDHVLATERVAAVLGVPVLAHPADAPVWPHELDHLRTHGHFDAGTATADLLARDPAALRAPGELWDGGTAPVEDGARLRLGALTLSVLHTPGHTPGGLTVAAPGHLFTGDTLFPGGPGLTGWPLSDFGRIMTSVRRLMSYPDGTAVHPGHGADTTIGAERPHVDEWQSRGW